MYHTCVQTIKLLLFTIKQMQKALVWSSLWKRNCQYSFEHRAGLIQKRAKCQFCHRDMYHIHSHTSTFTSNVETKHGPDRPKKNAQQEHAVEGKCGIWFRQADEADVCTKVITAPFHCQPYLIITTLQVAVLSLLILYYTSVSCQLCWVNVFNEIRSLRINSKTCCLARIKHWMMRRPGNKAKWADTSPCHYWLRLKVSIIQGIPLKVCHACTVLSWKCWPILSSSVGPLYHSVQVVAAGGSSKFSPIIPLHGT